MPPVTTTETTTIHLIQTSIERKEIIQTLELLLSLAEVYIEGEQTQEGANLVAFILIHPETPATLFDQAEDIMLELESRICPRVLYDARAFAEQATFTTVIHYLKENPTHNT